MKLYRYIFAAGALALASAGFTSCSDDEEYDFPGDPYTRVYAPETSAKGAVVKTPMSLIASFEGKFFVKSNQPAEGEILASIAVDNSLIDAYNEENGTNYQPLPEGIYKFDRPYVTISSGEMVSDTALISLTDDETALAALNDFNGYILPVRLESVAGGGAQMAQTLKSISYFTIEYSEKVVDEDATKDNRQGTLVGDRAGWSVTPLGASKLATDWYGNTGDPASWFTDDSESCTFTNEDGGNCEMLVDLGREYKFDGITADYKYYGYYTYGSLNDGTIIYLSSDKTSWMKVAEIEDAGWSGKDFIGFYGPLPARYIKIVVPAGENSYGGPEFQCGNFNIYATN